MKMEILGVEVVAHNKREESLVNIINSGLIRIENYRTKEVFDNVNTMIIVCLHELDDIHSLLPCMYYIEMISIDERILIKNRLNEIKDSLYSFN